MDAREKEQMLVSLEGGRKALLDSLAGVTEEAAALKPGPGRWSILECVEHLAVAEEYLLGRIEASMPSAVRVGSEKREALIRVRGVDRSRRAESPEAEKPRGRFGTLAEASREFLAARARTIRFAEDCGEELRDRETTHPILGSVNCHEMLLMIAAHPHRHARQIEEIRGELLAT